MAVNEDGFAIKEVNVWCRHFRMDQEGKANLAIKQGQGRNRAMSRCQCTKGEEWRRLSPAPRASSTDLSHGSKSRTALGNIGDARVAVGGGTSRVQLIEEVELLLSKVSQPEEVHTKEEQGATSRGAKHLYLDCVDMT